MLRVKHWLTLYSLLMILAPQLLFADVLVEDFQNKFNDTPLQSHLGAAAGFSKFGSANVAQGGGNWFHFNDSQGSQITASGVVIDALNLDEMVQGTALEITLNTLHSAEMYPYAGIGLTVLGELNSYTDLTQMESITLRIKGSGTVHMELVTQDIDTLSGGNDWGYYGTDISLSANWEEITIPVAQLVPSEWSYGKGQGWNWNHGKHAVHSIQFLITQADEINLAIDSISFNGIEYTDLGFIYKDDETPESGPFDITINSTTLIEKKAGQIVTTLQVLNYDENATHTLSVNDERFEIVGSTLKLKEGVSVLYSEATTIPLTLTATDNHGDSYEEAVTLTVKPVLEGDVIKYGGARSSEYGAVPFPNPNDFDSFIHRVSNSFDDAAPIAIWIVGTIDMWGNCALEFPSDGKNYNNVTFYSYDKHEAYLNQFDQSGTKVYLQVESGMANMEDLIHIIMTRYGHHPCVAGFAVDVEWYESTGETNTTIGVTDAIAESWDTVMKGYNSNYQMVLKHWMPSVMPPNYRSDIIFLDDSQAFPNLEAMCEEFKVWADLYSNNTVMFQIGYDHLIDGNNDYSWWQHLQDPPKEMGEQIAATINNPTQEIGIVWVDFTMHYDEMHKDPIEQVTLTTTGVNGTVTGAGTFDIGSEVAISATADEGYSFVSWSATAGATVSDPLSPITTITLNGDATVTATFESDLIETAILTMNTTNGIVTGAGEYEIATEVAISATADAGYHFVGWSITGAATITDNNSATTTVTLNGDATVTATFEENAVEMATLSLGGLNGTVTGAGEYEVGTEVSISATADAGYHFVGWSITGAATITDNSSATTTVTLNGDATVTATFEEDAVETAVLTLIGDNGSVIGGGEYEVGSVVSITATPNSSFHFVEWHISGDAIVSDNSSATTTVTLNGDATVTASFEENIVETAILTVTGTNGSVTGSGEYEVGSTVTISATAATGYKFVSWSVSGDATVANSSESNTTVILAGDATVTATFELDQGCEYPTYDNDAVYLNGDIVSYNGYHWKAKWWTRGKAPYQSLWGVWQQLDTCE